MIVVSDTSPVTSLIHIGRLSLLRDLYGEVLVPEAVQRELSRTHPDLPSFLEVRKAQDREAVLRLRSYLDLGEAEAIVVAKETHADLLLIDERLGRQVAAREGVPISGLVGVLVDAKRQNMVGSVREVVAQLESLAGFRLSEAVKLEAFFEAGE
jgi:predicted nucleic acid-binding protein